jgi:hypothetical protein
VLVARWVAHERRVVGDFGGHGVQRLADGLALVVRDHRTGLVGTQVHALLDGGLCRPAQRGIAHTRTWDGRRLGVTRPGRSNGCLSLGNRFVQVDMSGHRRTESRCRVRRDRTSSDWTRISPDAGREGIGRPRDPRLNANEQAAVQCESASSCGLTSITGSSKTLLRCQCGDCIKSA